MPGKPVSAKARETNDENLVWSWQKVRTMKRPPGFSCSRSARSASGRSGTRWRTLAATTASKLAGSKEHQSMNSSRRCGTPDTSRALGVPVTVEPECTPNTRPGRRALQSLFPPLLHSMAVVVPDLPLPCSCYLPSACDEPDRIPSAIR